MDLLARRWTSGASQKLPMLLKGHGTKAEARGINKIKILPMVNKMEALLGAVWEVGKTLMVGRKLTVLLGEKGLVVGTRDGLETKMILMVGHGIKMAALLGKKVENLDGANKVVCPPGLGREVETMVMIRRKLRIPVEKGMVAGRRDGQETKMTLAEGHGIKMEALGRKKVEILHGAHKVVSPPGLGRQVEAMVMVGRKLGVPVEKDLVVGIGVGLEKEMMLMVGLGTKMEALQIKKVEILYGGNEVVGTPGLGREVEPVVMVGRKLRVLVEEKVLVAGRKDGERIWTMLVGIVGRGRDHMVVAKDGQVGEGGGETAKVVIEINLLAEDNLLMVSL